MARESAGRVVVVLVTCPSRAVGQQLAQGMVSARLAACVNLLGPVESVFRWQGAVDRAREVLLVVKTSRAQFAPLERFIRAHHPYDVPEILSLPVIAGSQPYLQWVLESCAPPQRRAR